MRSCLPHCVIDSIHMHHFSPGVLPSEHSVSSLIQLIEDWVEQRPVLTVAVEVFTNVSVNLTVKYIRSSESIIEGSGNPDNTIENGSGNIGGGSGPGPTVTISEIIDNSTNDRTNQTGPTSLGVVCVPSPIITISFFLIIFNFLA